MGRKMNYSRPAFQKKGYDLRDSGQDSRSAFGGKINSVCFRKGKNKKRMVRTFGNLRSIRECQNDINETKEKQRIADILKEFEWKETE